MSVKRLASAKTIFRITKDNIRQLEDDPNFSDADIGKMRDMMKFLFLNQMIIHTNTLSLER